MSDCNITQGSHLPGKLLKISTWKTSRKLLEFYVRVGNFWYGKSIYARFDTNGCIVYKLLRVTKEWMVNINDECLVFYIFWLLTITKSTWKILKLNWNTYGFFLFQKSGNSVTVIWARSWAWGNKEVRTRLPKFGNRPLRDAVHNCSTVFARWHWCARPSNTRFLGSTCRPHQMASGCLSHFY